jgi:hypothetical protein
MKHASYIFDAFSRLELHRHSHEVKPMLFSDVNHSRHRRLQRKLVGMENIIFYGTTCGILPL